ncbi:MAG TPA: hypothetical protein DDZ41_07885 [Flavobacterium sp.]|nr:hypothetical protein [Flavobacterium sp.]
MAQNIPVNIRPHLVSFLFKELEGKEASYMNTKSKTIKIQRFSSLGKILYSQINDSILNIKRKDHFIIFLRIEKKSSFDYQGHICIEVNKLFENLKLPEINIININNLLEDIFRISFIYYIEGSLDYNKDVPITTVIDKFIDKYDLLEVGYSNETLRRLYYREKNNQKKIARLQNQSSNRVINYR